MAECVEGYRISQLLKNLGVVHDMYEGITTTYEHSSRIGYDNNSSGINPIEFSSFVQDIYLNCKKLGLSPSIIISWITDLIATFEGFDNPGSNPDCDNNTNLILKSNVNGSRTDEPNPKQKSDGFFDSNTNSFYLKNTSLYR